MSRSVPSLLVASLAATLWGCDACGTTREEAVHAWDAVVSHALDVAAEWGETEVKDSTRGPRGMADTAARERQRWAIGLEKATRAREAMAAAGPAFMPVINQAADELATMEPPGTNQDWQLKLAEARKAAYLVQTVCSQAN
jgi:hypothetical protein